MVSRPLVRIADALDSLEEALRLAYSDGVVTDAEMDSIKSRLRAIAGLICMQDLNDALSDSIRRTGIASDQTARLMRSARRAHEQLGFRLLPGGRIDDPPDGAPPALGRAA